MLTSFVWGCPHRARAVAVCMGHARGQVPYGPGFYNWKAGKPTYSGGDSDGDSDGECAFLDPVRLHHAPTTRFLLPAPLARTVPWASRACVPINDAAPPNGHVLAR